ncbi:MAG: dienelactone hydrolase family protein [Actinomycetota bacterium]|nr:dienelactone hydrolase family protein [Actinomycetota bacterium]
MDGHDLTVDGIALYESLPSNVPSPGVLILHELFGLNDDIRRITDRFAALGYVAVAPDLIDGGRISCVARAMAQIQRGQGSIIDAAEEHLRSLADRDDVLDRRVAIVGFCMGGSFALLLGARGTARAISANYGIFPGDDIAERLCPVVASYGGKDHLMGRDGIKLSRALEGTDVPHDIVTYPNAGHSFMNQAEGHAISKALIGRPLMAVAFDEDASEESWERIEAFFAEHL